MEAPRRQGSTPPLRNNNNAVLLCDCWQPARLVVIPSPWIPGQRCWRCAKSKCRYCLLDGPWTNERNFIYFPMIQESHAFGQTGQAAPPPDSGLSPQVSSSSVQISELNNQNES